MVRMVSWRRIVGNNVSGIKQKAVVRMFLRATVNCSNEILSCSRVASVIQYLIRQRNALACGWSKVVTYLLLFAVRLSTHGRYRYAWRDPIRLSGIHWCRRSCRTSTANSGAQSGTYRLVVYPFCAFILTVTCVFYAIAYYIVIRQYIVSKVIYYWILCAPSRQNKMMRNSSKTQAVWP
jgi:hypothetical protein